MSFIDTFSPKSKPHAAEPNEKHPTQCFAHYHLTIQEYGFWTYAREVSHESGVLFFDGRRIAYRFDKTTKGIPYRLIKALKTKGWAKCTRASKRLKNGMFAASHWRILTHDEWAKEHPGACAEVLKRYESACQDLQTEDSPVPPMKTTCPASGTGKDSPVPYTNSPVPPMNSPVPPMNSPVPPAGHNLKGESERVIPDGVIPDADTRKDSPVPPVGLVTSQHEGAGMGEAPLVNNAPVPPAGQAEPPAMVMPEVKRRTREQIERLLLPGSTMTVEQFLASNPTFELIGDAQ